ncbi:hypothetical protein FZC30_13125 [Comamonas thiooxydans]|nr:hypothetical protein FZC30_13125 [Comamonas thiooxydans]
MAGRATNTRPARGKSPQGNTDASQHSRYLLNLNYDSQGRSTQPHAQPIALAMQKAPRRGFCSVL